MFFLIWTLVTGFFGQNFGFLTRHIDTEKAFWLYEIGALVLPTIVLVGAAVVAPPGLVRLRTGRISAP